MDHTKSHDEVVNLIVCLLNDAHIKHAELFNSAALKKTVQKVYKRVHCEGLGFLTKTLPSLGKGLDQAFNGVPLDSAKLGFKPLPGSKLPRFLGELFAVVLQSDGSLLPNPSAECVRTLRQLLYVLYKYELPYTSEQEQTVVEAFRKAEDEIIPAAEWAKALFERSDYDRDRPYSWRAIPQNKEELVLKARSILADVFGTFDPKDIYPRHGPGAVATKQQLWDKYLWKNVSANITNYYPFDEYFMSSIGHVCDAWQNIGSVTQIDHSARVCLVPKDSRGPRLISCEPVDYQWIQQGLGRAIVQHVESHRTTRYNVFFTDQAPNQRGALLGSTNGKYATLDLKEASDRNSLDVVRLLFPSHLYEALVACRSSSTILPNGEVLRLRKFAPMGSCLCFPVMALTIWAILTAAAPDADTRDSILVYGDDIIVPTAFAESAMTLLEEFGFKSNRSKSFYQGPFRESCGVDAFKGIDVTPVRIRTVWQPSRSPDVYSSWVAYANSFWDRRCYATYSHIVGMLGSVYGQVPTTDMNLSCPSLRATPRDMVPTRTRWNPHLQRREFYVWDVGTRPINHEIDGWSMLLRFFTEGSRAQSSNLLDSTEHLPKWQKGITDGAQTPFRVRSYTRRRRSMLRRRWR